MSGEDPLLVPSDRGPTVFHRGIALYPPANPQAAARGRARAARLAPRTLVYVPSVGLGHGLADLLDRLPGECAVLCVETDPALMRRAAAAELPRDARLAVVQTSDGEEVARAARSLGIARFRRVVEVPLCAGYRLDAARYTEFGRVLEAVVRTHWQDAATLISMGSLWVRNIIDNLAVLPSSRDFSCLTSDAPLVVAGAGPSLEQSLPALKEARAGFLLAAADTALPRLMEESLEPDIVVALEAQLANIQDFLPSRGAAALLACELSAHPATARLFPRGRFFFSSRFAPLALFGRLAEAGLLPSPFPALGSVGVAAAHAGLRLTGGDVFLTGLDFSFPGSRTHARGTPPHLAALRSASRVRGVDQDAVGSLAARRAIREKDKAGDGVMTDLVLRSYRDGLRVEAAGSAGRVWDLGRTGLDLGISRIDEDAFLGRVRAAGACHPRITVRPGPAFPAASLLRFLDSEISLLDRAVGRLASLLSAAKAGAEIPVEDRSLLAAVDYTFLHFPDGREPDALSRSFLARARVAALYYRQRIARAAEGASLPRS
jgi:hypothetical protein